MALALLADRLDLFRRVHDPLRVHPAPTAPLWIETPKHILKTVESRAEWFGALKLRYRVFHRELAGRWLAFPFPALDVDAFDLECDHIVIIDKASDAVVGTYRLLCSSRHPRFYSATEFDLAPLLDRPGVKLELGRACVDPAHRDGAVIALLWKGIAAYGRAIGAQSLFGCTSFKTTEPREIAAIAAYLESSRKYVADLRVRALPDFATELPARDRSTEVLALGRSLLPKLFLAYLRAGARVCSEPAIDRAFRCTDFLTLLEVDRLEATFARRFELAC